MTTQGLGLGLYEHLPEVVDPSSAPHEQGYDDEVSELMVMTDPILHDVVSAVSKSSKLLPEPGYELPGEDDEVLATAELAWPGEKLAILLSTEASSAEAFVSKNWTLFRQPDLARQLDELLAKLPMRAKDSE